MQLDLKLFGHDPKRRVLSTFASDLSLKPGEVFREFSVDIDGETEVFKYLICESQDDDEDEIRCWKYRSQRYQATIFND